jgi:hypothetical protein
VSVMDEPAWSTGAMILTGGNLGGGGCPSAICLRGLFQCYLSQSQTLNELAWNQTLACMVKGMQLNLLRSGMAYQTCGYNRSGNV